MKETKRLAEINERGLANGWHAEQLEVAAKRNGVTMATAFCKSLVNASVFNVPARAIKVTPQFITYRFKDGSEEKFPNQKR